jgi:Trypsin
MVVAIASGCTPEDLIAVQLEQEIVGGRDTTIQTHPWQVSVQLNGSHHCGGVVLTGDWVLSAQHCVAGRSAGSFRVVAGVTRLSEASTGQIRNVAEIRNFPNFTGVAAGKDVTLLRLASPLDLSGSSVRPIRLMSPSLGHIDSGLTSAGVSAAVTGWGRLSAGGPSSNTLQVVQVPLTSQSVAGTAYAPTIITDDQLGAGNMQVGGVDSCSGDSGGPLVIPDAQSVARLAGVVSWGIGCADRRHPGMYARVSSFSSWIISNVCPRMFWGGTNAMASLGEHLYIVQNERLHRVSPVDGSWQVLGPPAWAGTEAMTALNDALFIVQNQRLHRVSPVDGSWQVLGPPAWAGTEAMTALNDVLFIVQNQRLHRVSPVDGSWQVLGPPAWAGTEAMAALDGVLFVVQNQRLHRVSPVDGSWQVLGPPAWAGTEAMAAYDGAPFVVQNERLHRVLADGTWQVLGPCSVE